MPPGSPLRLPRPPYGIFGMVWYGMSLQIERLTEENLDLGQRLEDALAAIASLEESKQVRQHRTAHHCAHSFACKALASHGFGASSVDGGPRQSSGRVSCVVCRVSCVVCLVQIAEDTDGHHVALESQLRAEIATLNDTYACLMCIHTHIPPFCACCRSHC